MPAGCGIHVCVNNISTSEALPIRLSSKSLDRERKKILLPAPRGKKVPPPKKSSSLTRAMGLETLVLKDPPLMSWFWYIPQKSRVSPGIPLTIYNPFPSNYLE